jgi:hypothetical protein
MNKITRAIVTTVAAVAPFAGFAVASAAPASAATVVIGTFQSTSNGRYVSEVGNPQHPSSSGFLKFTRQSGVENETSFQITTQPDGSYTIRWYDAGGNPFGKYLAATFPGFFGTGDVVNTNTVGASSKWQPIGGKLVNEATGQQLVIGNSSNDLHTAAVGSTVSLVTAP